MSGCVLVIGVGNDFRRDDAAGLIVVRALRQCLPDEIAVEELSGEGATLMAAWEGAKHVFLCDAVSSSASAGAVIRIDALSKSISPDLRPCSSHAFGVAEAIELARAMGTLPPTLVVYGIVGTDFGAGVELSREARAGVDETVGLMGTEVLEVWQALDRSTQA